MELLIVGVIALVGYWVYKTVRANNVLRRHSRTLADITNVPSKRIYREMRDQRLTPGQWASNHRLDPMTFKPVGITQPASEGPEADAQKFWERVRLDPSAPPPHARTLYQIGELQEEFARLRMVDPPLPLHAQRMRRVLSDLYRLGSRVDGTWVNKTLDEHGCASLAFNGALPQEKYDEQQRLSVSEDHHEQAVQDASWEQVAAPRSASVDGGQESRTSTDAEDLINQLGVKAVQGWYDEYDEFLARLSRRTGSGPIAQNAFDEACETIRRVAVGVEAGELPHNTERVFADVRLIDQPRREAGLDNMWLAAYWLLREQAALDAFRHYLGDTPALEQTLRAWEEERVKLEDE